MQHTLMCRSPPARCFAANITKVLRRSDFYFITSVRRNCTWGYGIRPFFLDLACCCLRYHRDGLSINPTVVRISRSWEIIYVRHVPILMDLLTLNPPSNIHRKKPICVVAEPVCVGGSNTLPKLWSGSQRRNSNIFTPGKRLDSSFSP